jgi:hypothetical protein
MCFGRQRKRTGGYGGRQGRKRDEVYLAQPIRSSTAEVLTDDLSMGKGDGACGERLVRESTGETHEGGREEAVAQHSYKSQKHAWFTCSLK